MHAKKDGQTNLLLFLLALGLLTAARGEIPVKEILHFLEVHNISVTSLAALHMLLQLRR